MCCRCSQLIGEEEYFVEPRAVIAFIRIIPNMISIHRNPVFLCLIFYYDYGWYVCNLIKHEKKTTTISKNQSEPSFPQHLFLIQFCRKILTNCNSGLGSDD